MRRYSRYYPKRRRVGSRYGRRRFGRVSYRRSFASKARYGKRYGKYVRRSRFYKRRFVKFGKWRRGFRSYRRKIRYAADSEAYTAVQGPVPFPLDASVQDGVQSFVTTWNSTTNALTFTNVDYGTSPWFGGGAMPTDPAVFGTTGPTAVMGYEFIYSPNLLYSLAVNQAVKNGVQDTLESLFNFYYFVRVAKINITFERRGQPSFVVQDVGLGADDITQNVHTAGAEAYFAVCRFGNYYTSTRPADGTLTWTPEQAQLHHAFFQMQNDYPRQRRRIKHIRDMRRARRFSFRFAPTITSPQWITGFDETSFANASLQTRYRPNTGVGGEFQPQRFRRVPWMRTVWKNNDGTLPFSNFNWTMHGLCGALKPGSWRPGDWTSWTMRASVTLQFKRRRVESTASYDSLRPVKTDLNRWMENYSYNLNPGT